MPQAAEGSEMKHGSWISVADMLYDVLFLWKQQKDDVPWTKFSKQCNYKMAKW